MERDERAGIGSDEARKRRERRRRLIKRLNQNDTFVPRARRPGEMSEEELAVEVERQWNYSRRGFGQII